MNFFKAPGAVLCFVLITGFYNCLNGQTFEEFKNQVNTDYKEFREKTIQSFNEQVEKTDKAFADYLVSNFEEHALTYFRPEPENKPEAVPSYNGQINPVEEQIRISAGDNQINNNEPVLPIVKKTEEVNFEKRKIDFDFFGSEIETNCDTRLIISGKTSWSPEAISDSWTELSKANYNHIIEQFHYYQQVLNLNDWAYYLLVSNFSKQLYPSDQDMQNLLSWFLLSRSGYKTRIAFDNDKLYLLLSSVYPVQGDYIRLNNTRYYLLSGHAENIQTYEKDTPQTDRIFDFSIKKPLNFAESIVNKNFKFDFDGKEYQVDLSYNKNLIDFYSTLALSDIDLYFNSLAGTTLKHSVHEAFGPLIQGKNTTEAANLLLRFTQQAFPYQTDQQAFGVEKYMFPEELLHYASADCEDRAVFYAYLVKTLLKLDIKGVEFPGHIATAIHFTDNPPGEYIRYNGKQYVIADPTYIGAPIGMLMPDTDKSSATMIDIEPELANGEKADKIWQLVHAYGGYRSDILQDVVFAPSGNAYVCGYFIGEADFDGLKITSDYDGRDMFIARFDNEMNPVWVKKATGPGNDMAYSLALDPRGILYVYGSIEQTLDFNGNTISASDVPDVFVARYGPNGDFRWASKAGIDKIDHRADFMFSAKFDPSGQKIGAKLYNETKNFDHYGLYLDGQGNATITGSFYATTGLTANAVKNYNNINTSNIPLQLKDTNQVLLHRSYEKTIAGLFAALKIMQIYDLPVQGKSTQEALENNPVIISQAREFFENLGIVSLMVNKNDIVVINTKNQDDVDFGFIKIRNNARFKIVPFNDGNARIDILSGIYLADEENTMQFDINSISLFKNDGDLLLDYDSDHTKYKTNLRNGILNLN